MQPESRKPYTLYTAGGNRRGRVIHVILWVVIGLVAAGALGVVGVYAVTAVTLSRANNRVDPAAIEALRQQTTVTPSQPAAAASQSTTVTVPPKPGTMNILVLGLGCAAGRG